MYFKCFKNRCCIRFKQIMRLTLTDDAFDLNRPCVSAQQTICFLLQIKKAEQHTLSGFQQKNILNRDYLLFCFSFIICSCCFCIASRRAAKPVFFIFFGSFLLASIWARSFSSLVVRRMMSVVTTLINVEMK